MRCPKPIHGGTATLNTPRGQRGPAAAPGRMPGSRPASLTPMFSCHLQMVMAKLKVHWLLNSPIQLSQWDD